MVRCRGVPGRTRRGVYRRLAAHDPYDFAGETVEKGGKQGIKEEGQEQSATAADRREETTDLRFHPGGKAARRRAAIRTISACGMPPVRAADAAARVSRRPASGGHSASRSSPCGRVAGRWPAQPARGSPRALAIGIDAGEINGPVWSVSDRGRLRSSRADSGPQVLPPARATVPTWPHASTMIQWRRDEPADWFASADADCNKCLQNMTTGKCQKTADTSNRSHDHTTTRPSKRRPA